MTRHDHEIAWIVPRDPSAPLMKRNRTDGSNLTARARHELLTAASIEELVADERER